jgi:regulation of enolase protein 1 (concanavalin A-like superfamily)
MLAGVASSRATPFTDQDIGTVAAAGSATSSNGAYTVNGSGADIWGTADAFHFMYQQWTGDGTFIVRVTGMTNTNGWAKAGLMIRQDLTAGSPNMFLCTNPGGGVASFFRLSPGGSTTYYGYQSEFIYSPVWLKLVRTGNVMATYFSADGVSWQVLDSSAATVPLPATVYVGVAVTSHADGTLCTATFDHLNLADAPPSGLTAAARSATQVELTWSDNSARETAFQIERSTDNSTFFQIGTTGPDTTDFVDSGAAASTTYYYRVRFASANGPSDYSNVASATTTAPAPAGWTSSDLDGPSIAGQATESGGTFTIQGSGGGVGGVNFVQPENSAARDLGYTVYGAYDQFQFASKPWSGDGELVARVTSLSGPAGSEAGIMLRGDLTASALNVFLAVRSGGGLTVTARSGIPPFNDRRFSNQTSTLTSSASGYPLPLWLRLVRSSGTFTAYESADGASWTQVGSIAFPSATNLIAGLAVSSTKDGTYAYGTFDNVVFNDGQAATILNAPTGLTANVYRFGLNHPPYVYLGWTDVFSNETGFEIQRSTDNVTFTTIATTTGEGSNYSDNFVTPGTTYYYRVRAVDASGSLAPSPFTNAVSVSIPSDLYSSSDIGPVGATGSDSVAAGVYTVAGSGADIWGTADAFHYNYEFWTGDGIFTARLTGLTNTDGWAKAGIMIRENNSIGSRYVAIFANPSGNAAQQFRAQPDGPSNFTLSPYEASPMWLRLVRTGNVFQAFQSTDGTNWTAVGASVTFVLPSNVELGFAVTSHNAGTLATATFDHVSFVNGSTSPSPQAAAPTFSPGGGVYFAAQNVTITSATSGATIRYTTDGSAPTATTGAIYSGPITVSSTGYITAIAYENGFTDSAVTFASYYFGAPTPQAAAPTFSPAGGTYPSVQNVSITSASNGASVRYTTDGSTPTETNGLIYSGPVNISSTSTLRAIAYEGGFTDSTITSGTYTINSPPPSDAWADSDIGNVGVAGGIDLTNGVLSVRGSGADIWDASDAFHFAYQPWTGDAEVIAQVTGLDNTDPWAKVGVMIRSSLAADSPNAFVFMTPGEGAGFQTRAGSGGTTAFTAGPWWASVPYWIKLVRTGDNFSAYTSPDGATWALIATQTVVMPAGVYVGFAVTSHNNSMINTGKFADFLVDTP